MKKLLDKAGLSLMALGTVAIVVIFLVASFAPGVPAFNVPLFTIFVLPSIFFTVITLKDRLFGGLLAAVISALILVPMSLSLSSPEVTPPLFGLFAILVCLLLGGACILTSLAIHAPRKGNAKT